MALLQTSFLVHFNIFGIYLNIILILVILINFFEKTQNYGLFAAFIGGFFLDIFSVGLIGYQVLILLGISLVIKIFLKRYVRSPIHY